MFWAHPTPTSSGRHNVLGDGKEVLVYIDKPLTETSRARGSPPTNRDSQKMLGGENVTPVRRNSRYPTSTNERAGGNHSVGTPTRPSAALERDEARFLAIPELASASAEKTPRSDFGRTPSVGSTCGSAGSISRGHATDDSEASDDDEYLGRQEDDFEKAVLNISMKDGCIILEFPQEEGESRSPLDSEVFDSNGFRISLDHIKEDYKVPEDDVDEADEAKSSDGGSGSVDESSTFRNADEETWDGESCHFELQSTNVHSAEDIRQRERDKIRLAVLGAAVDAYKNISVEVPDLLSFQVNESRETMRLGSRGKNLASLGVGNGFGSKDNDSSMKQGARERKLQRAKDAPTTNSQKSVTQTVPEIIGPDQGGYQESSKNQLGARITRSPSRTMKLRLTPEDEIHALPCQCALTLVGMRGCSHLTPPPKSPHGTESNQLAESFITRGLFGADGNSRIPNGIAPKTPVRRPSLPVPHTAPLRPPARSSSFLNLISGGGASTGHKDDSMVRTSSAKAAEVSLLSRARQVPSVTTPEFLSGSSSVQWTPTVRDESLKLGGPPDLDELKKSQSVSAESIFPQIQPGLAGSASREQRCEASSFTSMGYHEIVLLRRGSSKPLLAFDTWEALTIRCDNHDEMDVIVSSLKMVSKSTVVPFSPNPKAKLKKMQEKERLALKKRRGPKAYSNRKRRNIKLSSPEIRLLGNSMGGETSRSTALGSVPQSSPTHHANSRKKGESEQWNKCDHCEICMVNFTLLLRRHHCRKCDRSCCGSCSVVIASVGKGKRLCTCCFPKIANKSKKWSKEDHCEMCLCHFTLLTRRHHCRNSVCGKSVCGNCSSVLLVRGGEEKRYCNRCSTDILRKQSRELHRRFAGYQRRMTSALLPGKVHSDCRRLGVGVLGKLPHWRNYLSLNRNHRPAVGRITVELLEALAVPAIDVNGKADPYVRATITGYDRDMRWNLIEWNKTFSLCSSYCMGTLSPIWRGSGKKGGELLTLPVISTAGAVLRLEVMHYDILTNRRGRDVVLGVVEIPLSDITNANLRRAPTPQMVGTKVKRKLIWDGYCERWYQLQRPADASEQASMMAKPIPDPHVWNAGTEEQAMKASESHKSRRPSTKKNGMQSLEELGQRFQGWCRVPAEWVGSALNIDFPARRKDTLSALRSRSAIRVRLKLNCNEVGDLLSHVWFPPVEPYPPVPAYDPNILWQNIIKIGKEVKPYQKMCKFIEDTIKWRHPARTCIQSYCVFAFHLGVFPRLLYFLHMYLFSFLMIQLQKTARANLRSATDDFYSSKAIDRVDSFRQVDAILSEGDLDEEKVSVDKSLPLSHEQEAQASSVISSPSLQDLSPNSRKKRCEAEKTNGHVSRDNEETARLNKAVQWIAKRLGDNRGLEVLQFKLGMLGRDLTNLNSLWDGSSAVKICASMNIVFTSFVLHCYLSWRLLWIGGTGFWFFGSSPFSIRRARNVLGFWRGIVKVIRRRNLHEEEVTRQARK